MQTIQGTKESPPTFSNRMLKTKDRQAEALIRESSRHRPTHHHPNYIKITLVLKTRGWRASRSPIPTEQPSFTALGSVGFGECWQSSDSGRKARNESSFLSYQSKYDTEEGNSQWLKSPSKAIIVQEIFLTWSINLIFKNLANIHEANFRRKKAEGKKYFKRNYTRARYNDTGRSLSSMLTWPTS